MEMPENCLHCFMPCELEYESEYKYKRRENCPLLELPKGCAEMVAMLEVYKFFLSLEEKNTIKEREVKSNGENTDATGV